MDQIRKPFQGVWNVTRFNWHFYLLSFLLIPAILFFASFLSPAYRMAGNMICFLIAATTLVSLAVSYYVYDVSGLYKLDWLQEIKSGANSRIANINAGFDETSLLLKQKFPAAGLFVFDFYYPLQHTEVSIKRARKAYPPYPGTQQINTAAMPVPDGYFDAIFVLLAAHEIRQQEERAVFFSELKRSLKDTGRIIVTEHLRDANNFFAYNIGFFHFISKPAWLATFDAAGLVIAEEKKITPFMSTFILTKHGTAA